MSTGRAITQLLLPGLRQVLTQQAVGVQGCTTSTAFQAAGSLCFSSIRSAAGSNIPQLRHLATHSAAVGARKVSVITNLKQLSKFKLSSLVVLTASAGYVMGSGEVLDWQGLLWTSLGTFGAAACANTLNQVYEVANDRMMKRTCNRPLPAGRMSKAQAVAFAIAAGLMGLGTLYYQTNDITTALGAANIVLYAGVYTPLKQISIANTWVGALVGAIPPLMGWASATGQLDWGAFVLAGALFFWQLPHFMALAWLCKDDYLRGGFKMISGLDRSGKRTAAAALRNSIYLLPLGLLAVYADVATEPLAWEAAALGGMLMLPAVRFWQHPSQQSARKLFRASLLYLPLLMAGMVVHRQPYTQWQGMTLGEMQQAIMAHLEAPPHTGVLPLLRASMEQSTAAAARVLGFSHALIRCPSTVHSDDGSSYKAPVVSTHTTDQGEGDVGLGPAHDDDLQPALQGLEGAGLPVVPEVVVLRHAATMAKHHAVVVEQQQRRRVWVAGSAQGATWREGLDL